MGVSFRSYRSRVGQAGHGIAAIHRAALFTMLLGCARAPTVSQRPSATVLPAVVRHDGPSTHRVMAASVPLRRLTTEEYNNSVRDLFGDTSRPASECPPDDIAGGFETNSSAPATQLGIECYASAAETVACAAVQRLDALAPCLNEPTEVCATRFIEAYGRLTFRRPLEEAESAALFAIYKEKAAQAGHAAAIQLVIEALLQSPKFLYRLELLEKSGPEVRALSGTEVAARLSFFIWASSPDSDLLDAAAAERLASRDAVAQAARRLLSDPRAIDGIKSFHRQWLDLRELETLSKDPVRFPEFSPELKHSMVEETLRFCAYAVLNGGDTIRTLLTSKVSFVDASLAKIYKVPPPEKPFSLVNLPPLERSGVLTHASLMTVLTHSEETSPILRGKFIREKLLCQPVPPPPPGTVMKLPEVDPRHTKKQQFARHRTDPSCSSCHQMMEPMGFGFEHYDALGAWKTLDRTFPVDAVGVLTGTAEVDGAFDGAIELGKRLVESQEVRRCIATQWFRAGLGRSEQPDDAASLETAYQAFAGSGFDVRELIVAIASSDAFRLTRREPGSAE